MDSASADRLFNATRAFDHPVTTGIVVATVGLLILSAVAILILDRLGKLPVELCKELWQRLGTWVVLVPLMLGPVLLGGAWTILAVMALSLLCYREFARATGLFRQKFISLTVVIGIIAESAAAFDHWYGLFAALGPLGVIIIAAVGILSDQPKGYVQRVALGAFGYLMFGVGLGHLAYFANDANYRPILIMLVFAVEANDIFGFCCGKLFGKRKLIPNTSPGKTLGGALGALVLTTALVAILGHYVFIDTAIDRPVNLIFLGLLVSVGGQLGDLMISSIKRDIGVKDIGTALPGHGGLLDRFDSLLLVAPAVFHFVGYFEGVGLDQPVNIFFGPGPGS